MDLFYSFAANALRGKVCCGRVLVLPQYAGHVIHSKYRAVVNVCLPIRRGINIWGQVALGSKI